MSKNFQMVKNFFDSGAWSIEKVKNAVIKNYITEDEFFSITGKKYKEMI